MRAHTILCTYSKGEQLQGVFLFFSIFIPYTMGRYLSMIAMQCALPQVVCHADHMLRCNRMHITSGFWHLRCIGPRSIRFASSEFAEATSVRLCAFVSAVVSPYLQKVKIRSS